VTPIRGLRRPETLLAILKGAHGYSAPRSTPNGCKRSCLASDALVVSRRSPACKSPALQLLFLFPLLSFALNPACLEIHKQGVVVQIAVMKLPPLDVILTWPAPDYVHPETRGPALVIVNSIFISLVFITVAARLYTRIVISNWFGIDDVFILLALVGTTTTPSRNHLSDTSRSSPPAWRPSSSLPINNMDGTDTFTTYHTAS
jgi:hypothetical protein